MPELVWPVYGFSDYFRRETVAIFTAWTDAASFAMRPTDFGCEQRNLYIGKAMKKGNRAHVG